MPASVGVLCPKGGTEGIDPIQRQRVGLGVELSADRQECGLAEEVLAVIHLSPIEPRCPRRIQTGHLKHLTSTLRIAGGDERRMDVEEVTLLEELMGCIRERIANTRDGTDGVRARSEMRDLSQVLERDSLLLEGVVVRICEPKYLNVGRLDFHGLALAGRLGEDADDSRRRSDRQAQHIRLVIRQITVGDDLQAAETGSIVQFDEREPALRVTARPHPPGDSDLGPEVGPIEHVLDELSLHGSPGDESARRDDRKS